MLACRDLVHRVDLLAAACLGPAERRAAQGRNLVDHRAVELAGERDGQTPEQHVGQMFDAFEATDEIDLPHPIIGKRGERTLPIHALGAHSRAVPPHRFAPRAVTIQQRDRPLPVALAERRHAGKPRLPRRGIAGIIPPPADRQLPGIDLAAPTEPGEHIIRHLLGKATEGGPLAAHQRQHRPVVDTILDDGVIAADLARVGGIAARQRAHPAVAIAHLFRPDRDAGKQVAHRLEHVIALVVVADGLVRLGAADVRRPDQHMVHERIDQTDPSVRRAEVDHAPVELAPDGRHIDDQMSALGAADMPRFPPQLAVDLVDPGTTGVDDELRLHRERAALFILEHDRFAIGTDEIDVIERHRPAMGSATVVDQFEPEPLGLADRRVVIGVQRPHVAPNIRQRPMHLATQHHRMARHAAKVTAEEVVERQPHLADQDAAVVDLRRTPKEALDRRPDAAPPAVRGHRRTQRMHHVRRVAQQQVALSGRLRHQPELAGLQILEATMDQPRGRGAGPGAEILLVDDQGIDPLQCQIAKQPGAIDPGTDDQHRDRRVAPQAFQCLLARQRGWIQRFRHRVALPIGLDSDSASDAPADEASASSTAHSGRRHSINRS